ncbi:hypothetical protein D3C84_661640 [compost metagenome]
MAHFFEAEYIRALVDQELHILIVEHSPHKSLSPSLERARLAHPQNEAADPQGVIETLGTDHSLLQPSLV